MRERRKEARRVKEGSEGFFLICKISRESWDAEVCERVSGEGWEGREGGATASLRSEA